MDFRDRLRAAWRFLGDLTRRDPSLYLLLFGGYAMVSGWSLILTEKSFDKVPQYIVAKAWGFNDNVVGTVMVLDALAVFWSLGPRRVPHVRALIALITGAFWTGWSFIVISGGWRMGLAATSGSNWVLFASLGLLRIASAPYPDSTGQMLVGGVPDA